MDKPETDQPENVQADRPAASAPQQDPLPQLPLKAGQLVDFTPPSMAALDPKPVFHLRVPGLGGRAGFNRHLIALCGEFPSDGDLAAALRRAVKKYFDGDEASERLAVLDADPSDPAAVREIQFEIERLHQPYRDLIAMRQHFSAMMPVIALQHFLAGWDGLDWPFEKKGALVAESCLDPFPRLPFMELGTYAMNLMSATEALARF